MSKKVGILLTSTFYMNMYHFYNSKKQVLVRKHGNAVSRKPEKDQ